MVHGGTILAIESVGFKEKTILARRKWPTDLDDNGSWLQNTSMGAASIFPGSIFIFLAIPNVAFLSVMFHFLIWLMLCFFGMGNHINFVYLSKKCGWLSDDRSSWKVLVHKHYLLLPIC